MKKFFNILLQVLITINSKIDLEQALRVDYENLYKDNPDWGHGFWENQLLTHSLVKSPILGQDYWTKLNQHQMPYFYSITLGVLAIIASCKKFHNNIYGKKDMVINIDHPPLV